MQIDFHHAATYVVSRLAGFAHGDALTIARSAQMVDESDTQGTLQFNDSTGYYHIASAHKLFDPENGSSFTDYQVWLPFHFLPGNNGAELDKVPNVPLVQRLTCTEDSQLANAMWQRASEVKNDPTALYRLGITAHVYADTFSHQGFVGFRHPMNRASEIDHIDPNDSDLVDNIEAQAADLLELGHGGVVTDPDLPFLTWSYKSESGRVVTCNNPERFLRAVTRMQAQMAWYQGDSSRQTMLESDRESFERLIHTQQASKGEDRHPAWLDALRNGEFTFEPLNEEQLGDLEFDAKSWELATFGQTLDHSATAIEKPADFESSPWKLFNDALKAHQQMVLNDLLPACQLPQSYQAAQRIGL